MKHVLFVCTGNTCRSAMAEYLLRDLAEKEGVELTVKSAGLHAGFNAPAAQHAVTVLQEVYNIDMTPHRARPITNELLEWADYIIPMTGDHADYLRQLMACEEGKLFTPGEEIADPYGGTRRDYVFCAWRLFRLCEEVLGLVQFKLQRLRRAKPQDAAAIAALEAVCFEDPWSEQSVLSEIQKDNAEFLCLWYEDKLLGYGSFYFVDGVGYINNIAVHPDHRQKGIGGMILGELRNVARRLNLREMTLEVRCSNEAAMALYASRGFEQVGKRINFYRHPQEDAVLMTWKVIG